MTRRAPGRASSIERPRRKGWWGIPEEDQVEDELEQAAPAPREPVRRTAATRAPREVTPVGRALTPAQVEAIRAVMRLFVDDDMANGVDVRSTLFCHRCQATRRAIGSVRYDRFTFCNDCSTEYEITRARSLVDTPSEYIDRSLARAASA
jgi:hypothetical protein